MDQTRSITDRQLLTVTMNSLLGDRELLTLGPSSVYAEAETEQEKNKDVARQFYKKVWQEHDSSFINEVTTEDFDRAGAIAFADTIYARFPDNFIEVVDMIAEDDKVAVVWQAKGTSAQELSKGKEVAFSGMDYLRFEGGKIAETQSYWNQLSIMEQLGFTLQPPSAEPAAQEE